MNLIKINEDGSVQYPYTVQQAREDFPNVSFAVSFPSSGAPEMGIHVVHSTPRPGDPRVHNVSEAEPVLVDGEYHQAWAEPAMKPQGEIDAFIASKVESIKKEANRRIVERMPEWKQRNYLAYSLEVTRRSVAGNPNTSEEDATIAFIEGEWAFAKAVRSASDALESYILGIDPVSAASVDITDEVHWT